MEKDLAQELKKDKYYEDVVLPRKTKEKNNSILSNTLIEERNYEDENGKANVEYGVYIKFNGEDVLIANINEKGKLEPNMELLNDDKYSDEDKKKLGDMLNLLGLEKDNVDIEKLQEQLKEIEPKTKEEIEQEREKQKEKDSIKDEEQEQTDEEKDDYIRTISQTNVIRDLKNVNKITLVFVGTGFLRYMVRNMVGLLIEIGEGKRKSEEIITILKEEDRRLCGKTANPEGLYLKNVFY